MTLAKSRVSHGKRREGQSENRVIANSASSITMDVSIKIDTHLEWTKEQTRIAASMEITYKWESLSSVTNPLFTTRKEGNDNNITHS
jgi:queuine/archaeosine tRNA-ribosyltransferase